jgi:hypothetical protein
MARKRVKIAVLSNFATFFNGMATAWAFAAYISLTQTAWSDLLISCILATLSLSTSIVIGLKLDYVEHPRFN